MKKLTVSSATLLIFILIWSFPAFATAPAICFYKDFVRGFGAPTTESHSFPGIIGPATVKLWNGATDDGIEKVSSTEVYINGELVFGSNNFNQNVSYLEATIEVGLTNTIDVTLKSKPWGTIKVEIVQEVEADAAAFVGPLGRTIVIDDPLSDCFGTEINVPPDALEGDTLITITKETSPLNLPENTELAGIPVNLGPGGLTFSTEVFVTLPYNDNDNEENIQVITFDDMGNPEYLTIHSQDMEANYITASTYHFSIFAVITPSSSEDFPVNFPDPNLEAAIREAINKPEPDDIMYSDLQGLTNYLNAYSRGIENIDGLQYCTNLDILRLGDNLISDISPLAGLVNLSWLFLSGNQISNISALAGLTNLGHLGLSTNQITDISALAGLTNLSDLYLNFNQINDISPLAGLTNLSYLHLSFNQISNISALAGLTNLIGLILQDNQITDISPLAGLTNLWTYLVLSGNQISNISALAGLINLNYLSLGSNQITDISALAGLTNLDDLSLGSNQITDISALAGLTNLWYLSLEGNQISNISALAGLTNLSELRLHINQISDISPLVSNSGIGSGDFVNLSMNLLDSTSCTLHIPELYSRGVTVYNDCFIGP